MCNSTFSWFLLKIWLAKIYNAERGKKKVWNVDEGNIDLFICTIPHDLMVMRTIKEFYNED